MSVGNAILDSEHRNLITKVNNIMSLIETGDYAALPGAFELLETWLMTHFENERTFAQARHLGLEPIARANLGAIADIGITRAKRVI